MTTYDKMLEVLKGISYAMHKPGNELDFFGDQDSIHIVLTVEQCRHLRQVIQEAEATTTQGDYTDEEWSK